MTDQTLVTREAQETKPGVKTTEFWFAVVLPYVIALLDSVDWVNVLPDKWQFALPIISSAIYALSRGRAKQGEPYYPKNPLSGELRGRVGRRGSRIVDAE